METLAGCLIAALETPTPNSPCKIVLRSVLVYDLCLSVGFSFTTFVLLILHFEIRFKNYPSYAI